MKRAEEHLTALAKQFKRAPLKSKAARRTQPTPIKPAARKIAKNVAKPVRHKARRTRVAPLPATIVPPPDATILATSAITPRLPTASPLKAETQGNK
ncbi:MAG: hypothetical protein QM813_14555 [Verrucomicrobiota bacterium]